MENRELANSIGQIQEEMNIKAMQLLRKHLQNKKCGQLYQHEMKKFEEDLAKNVPLTSARLNEMLELMVEDLEAGNAPPVTKTVPAAKKVIRAVGATPLKQKEKTVPSGIFEKMVQMFGAHSPIRSENSFPYSENIQSVLNPDYTPPGLYPRNNLPHAEFVKTPSNNSWLKSEEVNPPPPPPPNPVYYPSRRQAAHFVEPYLLSLEERLYMEGWQSEQLRNLRYDGQNFDAAYRNPFNPNGPTQQTKAPVQRKEEQASFENFSPKAFYSTELGRVISIEEMEKYVIEQNRLIGKTAAARMLDFQTSQLDELMHPGQRAYDPAFPKPIMFGSNTVRFRIGDILQYIRSKR